MKTKRNRKPLLTPGRIAALTLFAVAWGGIRGITTWLIGDVRLMAPSWELAVAVVVIGVPAVYVLLSAGKWRLRP